MRFKTLRHKLHDQPQHKEVFKRPFLHLINDARSPKVRASLQAVPYLYDEKLTLPKILSGLASTGCLAPETKAFVKEHFDLITVELTPLPACSTSSEATTSTASTATAP